jgi:ribose transport system substrate-binding protein
MKRRLSALALVAAIAAACGGGPGGGGSSTGGGAKSKRPVVGVSVLTETHDFYKELEAGMRDEAKARGLDLVITSCEMDPAKQASQIEDFVAQHVTALLVAPCDSAAVGANLSGAEQAGIPIFTVDIAAQGGKIVSHVASDNVQGGRLAAQALARAIGDKGKVLIIDHPTVASVQDRTKGFLEELQKHPEIKVVGRPAAEGQRAKAMAIMEDMLQANRDLKGVFGINDDSALGATAVLEAAGRKDVAVIGFDATPAALEKIRSGGPLKADVAQYPTKIGHTVIEMIARHLAGEKVPALVPIEVALVDAESLAGK